MATTPTEQAWQQLGLPPHGNLTSEWLVKLGKPEVPKDFQIAGKAPTLAEWINWVEALTDELAAFLWPRFDATRGVWIGAAVSSAVALTRADLVLMGQLKPTLWESVQARVPNGTLHRLIFDAEDVKPPGEHYEQYDPAMPAAFTGQLPDTILEGVLRIRPTMLMLKQRFQRPRPYQAAILLKSAPFFHLSAKSANTPSLVSGHCLQGALGGCTAFLELQAHLAEVDGAEGYLQQMTVDPGDRRVFAGVHYPSDNMASWFCALHVCENLFGAEAPAVKAFLWGAIQRSTVFKAIKTAAVAGSAFDEPLRRLETEATRAPSV